MEINNSNGCFLRKCLHKLSKQNLWGIQFSWLIFLKQKHVDSLPGTRKPKNTYFSLVMIYLVRHPTDSQPSLLIKRGCESGFRWKKPTRNALFLRGVWNCCSALCFVKVPTENTNWIKVHEAWTVSTSRSAEHFSWSALYEKTDPYFGSRDLLTINKFQGDTFIFIMTTSTYPSPH